MNDCPRQNPAYRSVSPLQRKPASANWRVFAFGGGGRKDESLSTRYTQKKAAYRSVSPDLRKKRYAGLRLLTKFALFVTYGAINFWSNQVIILFEKFIFSVAHLSSITVNEATFCGLRECKAQRKSSLLPSSFWSYSDEHQLFVLWSLTQNAIE